MCATYEDPKNKVPRNKKRPISKVIEEYFLVHTNIVFTICSFCVPIVIIVLIIAIMYGMIAPMFSLFGIV